MNREIEKDGGKRLPRLSDLRECGDIEQDADLVGMLYEPRPNDDEEEEWAQADWSQHSKRVNLLIAKQRNGPTGNVELLFRKSSMVFEPYKRAAHAAAPAQSSGGGYSKNLDLSDYE